jgi:uncharacterized YccA/Bax inhibitor family protein
VRGMGRREGDEGSALRQLTREAPLLGVLAVVAAGLAVGALHRWRAGALIVAAALLAACVLRLMLPTRRSGLLVVRSKRIDVAVLAVLGTALLALAWSVPEA